MEKYTSVDGFTSGGYLPRPTNNPVNYAAIYICFSLGDQYKSVTILDGRYY